MNDKTPSTVERLEPTPEMKAEMKTEMKEEVKVEIEEEIKEAKAEHTWSEEIEIAGNQLVEQVKELINEGNVRRLILRTPDNKVVLELPLTAGAVVGGVVTILAPVLAALGAFAALLARVKIEIVRSEEQPPQE
jgi:hypothetical protein